MDIDTRYNIGMYLQASFWDIFINKALAIIPGEEFYPGKLGKNSCLHMQRYRNKATTGCLKVAIIKEYYLKRTEPQGFCSVHTSSAEIMVKQNKNRKGVNEN